MNSEELAKLPTHHLMRVRVRTRIFFRLRSIAEDECKRTGNYVSVSDLVRSAILAFLRKHDAEREEEEDIETETTAEAG
jgi:hypothetical protein